MASRSAHRSAEDLRVPVTVWVPASMHAQLRAIARANGLDSEHVGPILVEAARRALTTEKSPRREPKRRPWTDADTRTLRRMYAERHHDSEIAKAMGRHQATILQKRAAFDMPPLYDRAGRPLFTEEQNAA